MTTWWTRGGGNQARGREKKIEIIFKEKNQYHAWIFVYASRRLRALCVHCCNRARNLWRSSHISNLHNA